MIYRSTQFSNSSYATTQGVPIGQSSFELQQSLQVRINGQIGRKVTVNVDFDDTKTDKKDISIVYKGDPDEVVQEALGEDQFGVRHAISKSNPLTDCVACHGSDLDGGSSRVSCYSCHNSADHTVNRSGTMHHSGSESSCSVCHAPNSERGRSRQGIPVR